MAIEETKVSGTQAIVSSASTAAATGAAATENTYSWGGFSNAAQRVPLLVQKFTKYMSAFAKPQAPQDHELLEHQSKIFKVMFFFGC